MTNDPVIIAAIISSAAVIASTIFAWISGIYATRVAKQNAAMQARVTQKIRLAEFRQNWINDLRISFVDFSFALNSKGDRDEAERAFLRSTIKILLLMNPNDKDYEKLRKLMGGTMDDTGEEKKSGATLQYIELCQKILKREWEVVKDEIARLETEVVAPVTLEQREG